MSRFSSFPGALLRTVLRGASRSRLPQVEGRLYLHGLRDRVDVKRDNWGIPSIYAQNRHDLFLVQGFVHAQDRLWQMEIHRRAATGTLSAMVGEVGLQTDRLSRTLGFSRLAEDTWAGSSDKVKADVMAYTAGINAYLRNRLPLPLEFSLLRHEPDPWTCLDSVAFGRMLSWVLSHGFASKLTRARLIEKVGPEAAAGLELFYPPGNPVTLPNGIEFNLLEPDGMLRATEGPFIYRNMDRLGRGSNAWVVSGKHTLTGTPILCNDMHLPITAPSLWYVVTLNCPSSSDSGALNVTGVSLPGVPYVLVGHNDSIAWGATVSFVDTEDLFVERFSPDRPDLYEFAGMWRQAIILDESIEVRGHPNHLERVVVTHHGPLISPILPSNGQVLALASKALEVSSSFDGFALLNEATDWDCFVDSVQHIESPSINLFYADVLGNIGYYAAGRAPVRLAGTGQVPMPGWTGEHEWIDTVPFTEMPHALNPSDGFLVNANNRLVGDGYPHYLGVAWRNGYRARRIREFIEGSASLSPRDMQELQSDLVSMPALDLRTFLADCIEIADLDNSEARTCFKVLLDWNGEMAPRSAGALVYKTLVVELSSAILMPKLGRTLTEHYLGAGPHPILYPFGETHGQWIAVLLRLLKSENSFWIPKGESKIQLLVNCLASTARCLSEQVGNDISSWSWGERHQIEFGHTLSAQRPLDTVFNVGPYTVGGDADTVCQMSINGEDSTNNIAPSFRQVIDTNNWDASLAMHAPGQSGHLASPHYDDLSGPWLEGGYYSLNWSQDAIDTSTQHLLRLLPWLNR